MKAFLSKYKSRKNYEIRNKTNNLENQKKWTSKPHNYGLWYIRDSKNLSGFVGIFFFVLIMVIFYMNTKDAPPDPDPFELNDSRRVLFEGTDTYTYCSYDGCDKISIQCYNLKTRDLQKIQDIINEIMEGENVSSISVSLFNIEDEIEKNWLGNVTRNITSLTIQNTSFYLIRDGAFTGQPFEELTELTLISIGTINLTREVLSGLKLKTLNIRGPSTVIDQAQEDTLYELRSTLATLQLEECISDPEVLKNLTGGNSAWNLTALESLDISLNKYTTLLNDTFTKLPRLVSLYAGNSKLSEGLSVGVFAKILPTQVFLTSTQLTTLPRGIFEPFNENTSVDLSDNHFNCYCDFEWFQDLYVHGKMVKGSGLTCGGGTDLADYQFCATTTEATTSHTSSSTGFTDTSTAVTTVYPCSTTRQSTSQSTLSTHSPSTLSTISYSGSTAVSSTVLPPVTDTNAPFPPDLTTIDPNGHNPARCLPANKTEYTDELLDIPPITTFYLGYKNVKVDFKPLGDQGEYVVIMDKEAGDGLTFTFLTQSGWFLCLNGISGIFTLQKLEFGETYVVCLVENKMSPWNCRPLNVPEEWRRRTWIKNGQKITVIVGIISGILTTFFVSLFGIFAYVKRNPRAVYGKDNVIIIEKKTEDDANMNVRDRNYEPQKYPSSVDSWSDGYITPKAYESIEDVQRAYLDTPKRPDSYVTMKKNFDTLRLPTCPSRPAVYESVNFCTSIYPLSHQNRSFNSL